LPLDLDLIVEALSVRRPFDDSPGFDLALTGVEAFLATVFLTSDRFFATIFF
jgi:hypothetical protein